MPAVVVCVGIVLALAVAATDPERPVRSAGELFSSAVASSGAGALSAAPRRLVLVTLGTAALASQRDRRRRPSQAPRR